MKTLDDDDVVVVNGYIYARLLLLLDIIMIIDSSALGWTGKTPWKQTTGCNRAPFFLFLQLAVRGASSGVVDDARLNRLLPHPPVFSIGAGPPSTTFFYITAAAGRSRWRVNLDEAKKEEEEKKLIPEFDERRYFERREARGGGCCFLLLLPFPKARVTFFYIHKKPLPSYHQHHLNLIFLLFVYVSLCHILLLYHQK